MPSFRLDPYLWVHLAGLAAVPIWLDICLLGLAAGSPVLPVGVEIALLVLMGSVPVVWMQWQKPFCIYSLVFLALRPAALDESQRRTLRLFRGTSSRLIALLVPILLGLALWKIYAIAPIASEATPFSNRAVGFLAAAIAFLLANLFTQVPASVIKVLLTSERTWAKLKPYPTDEIRQNFTLVGLPVKQILPTLSQSPLSQPTQSTPPPAAPPAPTFADAPDIEADSWPDDDPWPTADEPPADSSSAAGLPPDLADASGGGQPASLQTADAPATAENPEPLPADPPEAPENASEAASETDAPGEHSLEARRIDDDDMEAGEIESQKAEVSPELEESEVSPELEELEESEELEVSASVSDSTVEAEPTAAEEMATEAQDPDSQSIAERHLDAENVSPLETETPKTGAEAESSGEAPISDASNSDDIAEK